ncbi:hypothetical protein HOY80DRAFT_33405 [Tuber brumale]|nr:hypothetical protein HOY80DRAFT_33405 [Tuber brumale]
MVVDSGVRGECLVAIELEQPSTQDQINKLFTTFACLGPVPRTCLESIDVTSDELYNESLEIYLSQVDREIDAFIAYGGRETIEHTVHQDSLHGMAIMHTAKKTGLSYTVRITTRWMAYRVYEKALRSSQHDCFPLFQSVFPTVPGRVGEDGRAWRPHFIKTAVLGS